MEIVSESDNRIKLESDGYYAVISKDYFGKKETHGCLMPLKRKTVPPTIRWTLWEPLRAREMTQLLPRTLFLETEDNVPSSNIQTSGEENSRPIAEDTEPQLVKETPKPKTSKPKAVKETGIVAERKKKVDKKFTLYNYAYNPKSFEDIARPYMMGVFLDPDGGWAICFIFNKKKDG